MVNNILRKFILAFTMTGSVLLLSCSGLLNSPSGTNYMYTYTMVQPGKSDEMIFRDNYIYIQFKIDASAISFQLQNVSEASMSIVWEKTSLGRNKKIYAIRNKSTFYSSGNAVPAQLLIPPLGYIRETVIPRENINYEKEKWVEKDLFLNNDRGSERLKKVITGLVGSEVALTIPIKISEIVVDYQFVFKVSKISPLPSDVLPPVKDRPPTPKTPIQEASVGQDIVPIIIAAGIFGVAIYLFSQKKTPAADL